MTQFNDQEAYVLSQLAYMDIVSESDFGSIKGKTLQQVAQELLLERDPNKTKRFGGWGNLTDDNCYEILGDIASGKYTNLSNLTFKDFTLQEAIGFVAYAFADSSNPEDTVFAIRGTMGSTFDADTVTEIAGYTGPGWLDNYNMALSGYSAAFAAVQNFVSANIKPGGKIFVTGHSRGGGLAMYIPAVFPGATGIVFDAPGVGQMLNPMNNGLILPIQELRISAIKMIWSLLWDCIRSRDSGRIWRGRHRGCRPQRQRQDRRHI